MMINPRRKGIVKTDMLDETLAVEKRGNLPRTFLISPCNCLATMKIQSLAGLEEMSLSEKWVN